MTPGFQKLVGRKIKTKSRFVKAWMESSGLGVMRPDYTLRPSSFMVTNRLYYFFCL